ncbi:MAG: ABC transporter permease [Chitinophagales bacterium]|nr:ABC transporter permease [Chitinophagales bacterium]
MKIYLKIIWESFLQAVESLRSNTLRTLLSLLGITIGIFCIITVKSAVDSLQDNIVQGFNKLGSDVIYLDRRPWNEDPGQNYWKYEKRPNTSYQDYQAIHKNVKGAKYSAFIAFTGGRTIKYRSSAISNAFIMGSTEEYASIQDFKLAEGRLFNPIEYANGTNKIVLGSNVYNELFQGISGINKEVKLFGQNYQVIGYLEPEGQNVFNFMDFDNVIWTSFNSVKKYTNVSPNSNTIGRMLVVKAEKGTDMEELKGEVASVIRASRRLRPLEDNNFSMNELSMLTQILEKVFKVLNLAGFVIGIFALVVGMVSVANIMFVSVKERTNIIGIKKALGAKKYVILSEFLIESIILCIIGGILGLLLVFLMLKAISGIAPFGINMSVLNAIIGIGTSILVGIISGIIPASKASSMDPVEAIRH